MSDKLLAIVIPAYKPDFLEATLQSLALQTNQDFTIYIGDDNSPHNLYPVIAKFTQHLNIVYKKFSQNLGGTNLVQQWSRCVELINKEDWIWLFSDDDLMGPNCVEVFYNEIKVNQQGYDVYRFNTEVINTTGEVIRVNPAFSNPESSYNFLTKKLKGQISSFVTEYIFSAKVYRDTGGFVSFPLAWASDDATWINFAHNRGIYTLAGAIVYWRLSEVNISNTGSKHGNTKCFALLQFAKWSFDFFNNQQTNSALKPDFITFIFNQMEGYKINLSLKFMWRISKQLNEILDVSYLKSLIFFMRKHDHLKRVLLLKSYAKSVLSKRKAFL